MKFKLMLNGKKIKEVEAKSLVEAASILNLPDYSEEFAMTPKPVKYLMVTDYSFQYTDCLNDDLEIIPS